MAESIYAAGVSGNRAYTAPSKTGTNPIEDRIISEYQRYLNRIRQEQGVRVQMGASAMPTYQQFKQKYLRDMKAAAPKPVADPGEAIGMALGYKNYADLMKRAAARYGIPELPEYGMSPADYAGAYAARNAPKKPVTLEITGSTKTRVGEGTMTPSQDADMRWDRRKLEKKLDFEKTKLSSREKLEKDRAARAQQGIDIARDREARLKESAAIRDEAGRLRNAGQIEAARQMEALGRIVPNMKSAELAKLGDARKAIKDGMKAFEAVEQVKGAVATEDAQRAAKAQEKQQMAAMAEGWKREHENSKRVTRTAEDKQARIQELDDLRFKLERAVADVDKEKAPELVAVLQRQLAEVQADLASEQAALDRMPPANLGAPQIGVPQQPEGSPMSESEAMQWLRNPANRNHPDRWIVLRALGI